MPIVIEGHAVGPGCPCFVIAEAGVNHNGDLALAHRLIEEAARCRADAIKFQTFRAERLASPVAEKAGYQKETTGSGESQLEMLRGLELSRDAHGELQARARELGLVFLSTPFDEESADFLAALGVPAFKVSSGDLTHLPFLEHLARFGKPMILSTGMADLEEVGAAVGAVHGMGNHQILLLQCVSQYPAAPEDCNLRAMRTMAAEFEVPVGFSDHTTGIDVALAAVALGACVLEKHFTLDRSLPGPDHRASLVPGELEQMIAAVRRVEAALGDGCKVPRPSELGTARVARRSLVAAETIPAGTILEARMIAIQRPGTGLAPGQRPRVVGRKVLRTIPAGAVLGWDDLE